MIKRVLALTLSLVCCFGILAGCNGGPGSNVGNGKVEIVPIPFEEKVTIELCMNSNTQVDPEGSYVDKMIEGLINVDLKITEFESDTQFQGMLAQKIVPDIFFNNGSSNGADLGQAGAYINIYDYLDQMPNVKAYIEAHPSIKNLEDENGKLYCITSGSEASTQTTCWIWRKDILDKHNLTIPTNQDEWYNTLKTLKSLYPNSTPFVMRQLNNYAWDKWWANWGITTNTGTGVSVILQPNGKVEYPFLRPEYKEWITFVRKLIAEGLLYEGWDTMQNDAWYAAFANDQAFVTYDKVDRIPFLKDNVCTVNANAQFVAAPGFAFGSNGVAGSYNTTSGTYKFHIGNNKNLSNTLAYINWLYSEEAQDYTNWGKEGETYTVDENGVRQFKPEVLADFTNTCLGTNFLGSIQRYDAFAASKDPAVRTDLEAVLPYATIEMPPSITFNTDEQVIYDTYKVGCNAKAKEVMAKFMLGDMDIEKDWDAYVKSLYDLELQKVIDIHISAYKRAGLID